jgi:hypothetical protein
MNIVKLQRQLQSVPEQALVGYVQNPDGRVPSYLALTELSRRKQMREEYQKAAAPEKSVAESMVEEASGIAAIPQQMGQPMPQQMAPQMPPQLTQAPQPQAPMQMAEGGLAALSLPDDMFDEESYAGGGIVAFDEGGDVNTDMSRARYAINKVMTTPIPGSNTTINDGLVRAFPHLAGRFESTSPSFMGGERGAMQGGNLNLNTASGLGRPSLTDDDAAQGQYQPQVAAFLNNPSAMSGYGYAEGGEVQRFDGLDGSYVGYEPPVLQLAELGSPSRKTQEDIARRFEAAKTQYNAGKMPKAVYDDLVGTLSAESKQAMGGVSSSPMVDTVNQTATPVPDAAPAPIPAAIPKQTQGVGSLTNTFRDIPVPTRPTLDRGDFVGEAPTIGGIQALRKDAYKQAGVSEDVYNEMRKDIKDRLSDIPKEREDAVAHAMIMAGLGIAGGTSQFALQNIAQGAIPAMTGFRSDVRELNNRRDKLAERDLAVMDAQNKFRQTGADSDLRELNDATKERRVAERDFTKLQTSVDEKYNDRAFQLQGEIAKADMDIAKTKIDADLKQQEVNIRKLDAESQDMYRKRPELFATILDNLKTDPKYLAGDATVKNKMITDAVSDARSTATGSGDNTLRAKALAITAKYFEAGGAGHKKYKELLKTNPTAATKMYNDYFEQQLGLAKSTLGADSTLSADPLGIL